MAKESLKVLLFLLVFQALKILVIDFAINLINADKLSVELIKLTIFLVMGILLLIWVNKRKCPLSLFLISNNKIVVMSYTILSVFVIFTIMTTPIFSESYTIERFIPYIYYVVFIPVFDELLFRGYLWNKLKQCNVKERNIVLITTFIFVIWNIMCAFEMGIYTNYGNIYSMICIKFIIGFAYGLVLGGIRLKCKNTFACILSHSILNMWLRII